MIKENKIHSIIFWAIIVCFATIYSLTSLVNHYNFRTYGLDLGMFNQAIYNFSHFSANTFTQSFHGDEVSYFGDHFSPITVLLSPFYYLFGSYTLLILQIASILLGGIGCYKIAIKKLDNKNLGLLILLQFYGIWAILSALSFDFHTNVIAAMIIPWFIYFWMENKYWQTILMLVLAMICKENIALWTLFISIGLWIGGKALNPNKKWKFDAVLVLISLIYFLAVMLWIMPSFQEGTNANHLVKYSYLGNSFSEIIIHLIKNPSVIFNSLFDGVWKTEDFTTIKIESHIMVLLSGGIFLLLRPQFLVMLIPIYLQKFLPADAGLWSMGLHYNIEFVPILTLALITFLLCIKQNKIKWIITSITIVLTLLANFFTLSEREQMYYEFQRINNDFTFSEHYSCKYDREKLLDVLSMIPDEVAVCSSSSFTPRIERRDRLFLFPHIKDAEYVVLSKLKGDHYPLNDEQFEEELIKLKNDTDFEIIKETEEVILFQKRK